MRWIAVMTGAVLGGITALALTHALGMLPQDGFVLAGVVALGTGVIAHLNTPKTPRSSAR